MCLTAPLIILLFCVEWLTDIYNSSSGYITSPYYPALYLNNMKRYWTIKVSDNLRVKLDWSFLNVEYSKQCKKDSVILKDSSKSRIFLSFCGDKPPFDYSLISQHNFGIVEFRSDKRNVGTGFKLHYQAVSGKEIMKCIPL